MKRSGWPELLRAAGKHADGDVYSMILNDLSSQKNILKTHTNRKHKLEFVIEFE